MDNPCLSGLSAALPTRKNEPDAQRLRGDHGGQFLPEGDSIVEMIEDPAHVAHLLNRMFDLCIEGFELPGEIGHLGSVILKHLVDAGLVGILCLLVARC